jgi:hypothetical protein
MLFQWASTSTSSSSIHHLHRLCPHRLAAPLPSCLLGWHSWDTDIRYSAVAASAGANAGEHQLRCHDVHARAACLVFCLGSMLICYFFLLIGRLFDMCCALALFIVRGLTNHKSIINHHNQLTQTLCLL